MYESPTHVKQPEHLADHESSFCRKTTLTKHFKRYHPIKSEDTGMTLVDPEDDDGCGDSDEEDSYSESETSPLDTQMKRQPSYYGDHWPLPCETAQHPNAAALQGQLALRPKSTVNRVKYERPRSVSPQMIRSIPPADGPTSSFRYPKGQTMSIQTQMEQDFGQIPLPNVFPQEQSINETRSPSLFGTETSMDSMTSPTTIQSSPTVYSDISSASGSAHTSLFFAGPTSQPYSSHDEPSSMGYSSTVPIEDTIQDLGQQPQFEVDSKNMIQMQVMYEEGNMASQQQFIQPLLYHNAVSYPVPAEQYGGPPPTWYTNIKTAESWYGPTPGERLPGYANWNQ